jgi:hypothetical protein
MSNILSIVAHYIESTLGVSISGGNPWGISFFSLDKTQESRYDRGIMRQNYCFSFNYWWWPKETYPTGER